MPRSGSERIAGRYRLRRQIGTGGMAVVWLAGDERLGRDVAVKFPAEALAADPDFRRRFEREARIAAKITHPNLVSVYDYGSEDGSPFLVMEYIEGETLATRLKHGPLSVEQAEALAEELLAALAAIHGEGVVHRDVKPSNILIDRRGAARMTDFGIARSTEASDLTQAGHVLGTARYMAPEVREGSPATPRSDLYSLGVVLGECAPAEARRVLSLARRLTEGRPSRRPRSAEEAARMLAVADDPTVPGSPDVPPAEATPPTERLARRPLRSVIALGASVAVLAGAAVAFAVSGAGEGGGSTTHSTKAQTARRHRGSVAGTPTHTVTQTVTTPAAETTEAKPPAAAPAPAPKPAPAADPCTSFDEEKKALDEEKHLVDERDKGDPAAQKAEHERLDAAKHVLDEEKTVCEKER
jgi:serine/threonine-protein kinase